MHLSHYVQLAVAFAGALALAACTGTAPPVPSQTPGGPSPSAPAPLKLTVQLQDLATPFYVPFYAAAEHGYFRDQGLEVEFGYGQAADIVKNVATGVADAGFPTADAVILGRAAGVPVRVVHTTAQQGIGALMARTDTGIRTPADLKGRSVAVTSLGSTYYFELQAMLASAGLSVRDVDVQVLAPTVIVDALAQGKVDAIDYAAVRAYDLRDRGIGLTVIAAEDFLPSYGNVLVISERTAAERADLAGRLTKALDRGIEWATANVDAAVTLGIRVAGGGFTGREGYVRQGLTELYIGRLWHSATTRQDGLGAGDLAKWDAAEQALQRFGLIPQAPGARSYVATGHAK